MPLLSGGRREEGAPGDPVDLGVPLLDAEPRMGLESRLMGRCSNPGCRSGWLHLFRKQTRPVFEGAWTCSRECTEARLQLAVRRELNEWGPAQPPHHHRIPLGLLMIEKGWITHDQLRRALLSQRTAGGLRIGEWLIRQGATDEATVSRALSAQWGCPVLSEHDFAPAGPPASAPRLLLEMFRVLPLGRTKNRLLYVGFEERVDPVLTLAVERIAGVRVESGIVPSSSFARMSESVLSGSFPSIQLAEAVSPAAAAHVLAKSIERLQPAVSRLVRVHEWLWLRMFLDGQSGIQETSSVSDVLCAVRAI